jgi:hypothetical protein
VSWLCGITWSVLLLVRTRSTHRFNLCIFFAAEVFVIGVLRFSRINILFRLSVKALGGIVYFLCGGESGARVRETSSEWSSLGSEYMSELGRGVSSIGKIRITRRGIVAHVSGRRRTSNVFRSWCLGGDLAVHCVSGRLYFQGVRLCRYHLLRAKYDKRLRCFNRVLVSFYPRWTSSRGNSGVVAVFLKHAQDRWRFSSLSGHGLRLQS